MLAWATAACSRREPGVDRQSSSPSASARTSATAVSQKRKRDQREPAASPLEPAATPGVPPQLVACGSGRAFYRITDQALEVFEVSKSIPPPQVRGSSAAVKTADIPLEAPLNVVAVANKAVLVIGKRNVFRYESGDERVRASKPIPTPGPLFVWPDAANARSFWVRVLGEKKLYQYTAGQGAAMAREQALADFDARLFTVLSDGTPFYSTPKGLVGAKDPVGAAPASKPDETATVVFPDVVPDRYWVADARGNLAQWDRKSARAPVFSAQVPGAVIDVALEGKRVAVLSVDVDGQSYRPTVTIFSEGQERSQRRVSGTPGASGPPELDVCLIPGRPWVVVGGKQWMELVDWETPRLLSEW